MVQRLRVTERHRLRTGVLVCAGLEVEELHRRLAERGIRFKRRERAELVLERRAIARGPHVQAWAEAERDDRLGNVSRVRPSTPDSERDQAPCTGREESEQSARARDRDTPDQRQVLRALSSLFWRQHHPRESRHLPKDGVERERWVMNRYLERPGRRRVDCGT